MMSVQDKTRHQHSARHVNPGILTILAHLLQPAASRKHQPAGERATQCSSVGSPVPSR